MYFQELREGVIPFLYLLKWGLDSLASVNDTAMKFNALDPCGFSTVFEDKVLNTWDIGKMNNDIIAWCSQRMDELTFQKLCFTIDPHEFIHDEPWSRQPKWGFMDDLHNSWKKKPMMLKHILTHPHLFS